MKEYMKPEIELVKFETEVTANTGISADSEAGDVL